MKVLVTGGAGFIGSTICSALREHSHTPVILDNLSVGKREFVRDYFFYEGDISNDELVTSIFKEHSDVECVIHCAALIVVPDSVSKPYLYYRENVTKSAEFFNTLSQIGVKNIVFSSSASIYDVVQNFMVTENSPQNPLSPYARTKLMMEQILSDFSHAYGFHSLSLRYFNPIGANPNLQSGPHMENATHILGSLLDVSTGKRDKFVISGDDWPTRDGTGIRDYVHVWDLAKAHVSAVENISSIFKSKNCGHDVINLGTGTGVTVKEFLEAFQRVLGKKISIETGQRRPGDSAGAFANANKALKLLGWSSKKSLDEGIADSLRWLQVRKKLLGF